MPPAPSLTLAVFIRSYLYVFHRFPFNSSAPRWPKVLVISNGEAYIVEAIFFLQSPKSNVTYNLIRGKVNAGSPLGSLISGEPVSRLFPPFINIPILVLLSSRRNKNETKIRYPLSPCLSYYFPCIQISPAPRIRFQETTVGEKKRI